MPQHNSIQDGEFSNVEKWTVLLLIALSFTGISVFQIGKAMLTPFHLAMGFMIAYGTLVSTKNKKVLSLSLVAFMGYTLIVNILQYPAIRYTSVLYTLIYGVEITILYNLLRLCRKRVVLFAFKCIIYLFLANIFIGFLMDTLGLRISALEFFIKVYYTKEGLGRPMGFSTEPSYAAFIISVVFLCYSHLNKHRINASSIKLIFAIILSILLSKSAYGFIFVGIIFLDWTIVLYRRGDTLTRNLYPLMLFLGIGIFSFVISNSENEALERIVKFTSVAMDSSSSGIAKMVKLQEADGSAFARVGPTYLLLMENDVSDFIVGNGAGAAGIFLAEFLEGILVDDERVSVDTGIIPALFYDYGFIGSILFFIFLWASFRYLPFTYWLLFILILPNANINTQLIWFCITCFMFVSMSFREQKYLEYTKQIKIS